VNGTFAGLPEGALFTQGGITYSISYVGGAGNDVVLTEIDISPTLSGVPATVNFTDGAANGDGKSDILLQNAIGTPDVLTMNATTVVATTTLANPGQTWHANTG
jgi:hypothetical protein